MQLDGTSRGELGAITNRGRLVRFTPVDLPVVPAASAQPAAGTPLGAYVGLADAKERIVGLARLDGDPIALGTASGVVKRVSPGPWPNKPAFDLIALKPGDEVVAAAEADDDANLVFVTSEAQLLRFAAGSVRPQGAGAGGMAGITVNGDARVIAFAVVTDPEAVVATASATDGTLEALGAGRGKLTPLLEFPPKGRATAGVRAQLLGRGETGLHVAWVGPSPALAASAEGLARRFPDEPAKRDGPGTPLEAVVDAFGTTPR
jgi:DNA gyrase subunit A